MDAAGKVSQPTTDDSSKKWTLRIAQFYSWVALAVVVWISSHAIPEVIDLDRSFTRSLCSTHAVRFADHANEWGQTVIRHHVLFVTLTIAMPIAAVAGMFFLRPITRMITLLILMSLASYMFFYVGRAIASST